MFAGWVPLRRGLLDHLRTGELSTHEGMTFVVLLMLADKETGRGLINAPVLRTYLPELSKDAAKRVLTSLEAKQYIFREITPRSPLIYPFWVNGYRPTTGRLKLRQLDLSKVFGSRSLTDMIYTSLAPEGAPEGAHYNKKEKNTDKEKSFRREQSASRASQERMERQPEHAMGAHSERHDSPRLASPAYSASLASLASLASSSPLRWSGEHGGYLDIATGRQVLQAIAEKRVAAVGLGRKGTAFIDMANGSEVPWAEAQQRISAATRRVAV